MDQATHPFSEATWVYRRSHLEPDVYRVDILCSVPVATIKAGVQANRLAVTSIDSALCRSVMDKAI
ncbi:hypothetical protein D3C74_394470 [compost metagenome]